MSLTFGSDWTQNDGVRPEILDVWRPTQPQVHRQLLLGASENSSPVHMEYKDGLGEEMIWTK
jgi:hypothetical protein